MLYEQLSVTEHLYSLSFGEGLGEVCSVAILKPHGHIIGTESGSKAGRVVYCAEAGIDTDSAALRNIVVSYLRLILDYCQRAYWRQNARITANEPDVLKRFHALLDQYYYEGRHHSR